MLYVCLVGLISCNWPHTMFLLFFKDAMTRSGYKLKYFEIKITSFPCRLYSLVKMHRLSIEFIFSVFMDVQNCRKNVVDIRTKAIHFFNSEVEVACRYQCSLFAFERQFKKGEGEESIENHRFFSRFNNFSFIVKFWKTIWKTI